MKITDFQKKSLFDMVNVFRKKDKEEKGEKNG